jgi:LmbE family N-acetylglucosaminyl deacetylase
MGRGLILLAVTAHPDDEARIIGGTLPKYAAQGVSTSVLCATRGERGSRGDPPLCSPEELPALRERELREACSILGVQILRLLDYQDGELSKADPEKIVGEILQAFEDWQPQVVITFGPEGRTGHPDHIAIHRFATEAFQRAEGPAAPAKLYYTAFPQSIGEVISPRFPGVPDDRISLPLDVSPWLELKRRAIAAHRTQARPPFAHLPDARRWEILSREYYILAESRLPVRPGPERDLFDGLPAVSLHRRERGERPNPPNPPFPKGGEGGFHPTD